MVMQQAQAWLAGLGWEKKIFLYAGILSLVPVLSLVIGRAPAPPQAGPNAPESVDTLIPRGFVLVPIEVQNYEALDSILGRFGVVDLFQAGPVEGQSQRLVARNVRILRAPQNPTHFAILIAEDQVGQVLSQGGVFTVIVKRPEAAGTEFVKSPKTKKRTIVYEGD